MIRLRDYPQIAALERAAILDPSFRARGAGWFNDKVDAACKAVFGVSTTEIVEARWAEDDAQAEDDEGFDEAEEEGDDAEGDADEEAHPCYAINHMTEHQQVAELEKLGWDARDEHGRPLLVLQHVLWPLLWAIAGDNGARLPGPPGSNAEDWGSSLEAEARRFRSGARR